MTWLTWFQRAISTYGDIASYFAVYKAYHAPLYDAVGRLCPPPATLLEFGAGIGLSAYALAERGYSVIALEEDTTLQTLVWPAQFTGLDVRWLWGNEETAKKWASAYAWEVVTCLGLVEHHPPAERHIMLCQLAALAPAVVVAIPSPLQLTINTPTMGEQPIGLDELAAEMEAAGLKVTEAFGWGEVPGRTGHLSFCVTGRRASVPAKTAARMTPEQAAPRVPGGLESTIGG